MNKTFSSKYEVCSEIIETKAVFTETEMSNDKNVNCLQNSPPKHLVFVMSSEKGMK